KRDRSRQMGKLAFHLADLSAEFRGASHGVAVPERHFAGLPRRGRNGDPVMRDLFNAPGASAENDGVSSATLEDHFFIELAHTRTLGGASEKNAVQPAVGDSATIDDGDAASPLAGGKFAGDAVPGNA